MTSLSSRCKAIKTSLGCKGERCGNKAKVGDFCGVHKKQKNKKKPTNISTIQKNKKKPTNISTCKAIQKNKKKPTNISTCKAIKTSLGCKGERCGNKVKSGDLCGIHINSNKRVQRQACSYSSLGRKCVLDIFREDLCSFHYREAQAQAEERRSMIEERRSRIESLIREIRTQGEEEEEAEERSRVERLRISHRPADEIRTQSLIKRLRISHSHTHRPTPNVTQEEAEEEAEERRFMIEERRSRIKSFIKRLRTQRLKKLNFLEDCKMTEKEDCCICLDSIEKNTTIKKISCNHHFHPECLNKWMNQNKNPKCPLCRGTF